MALVGRNLKKLTSGEALETPPKPPTILSSVAAVAYWDELSTILVNRGILTLNDLAELTSLCQALVTRDQAEAIVQKEGIIFDTVQGNKIPHPALGIRNTAIKLIYKMASDFGLNPASRAKINSVDADDDDGIELPE